jgi:hypothetical protein
MHHRFARRCTRAPNGVIPTGRRRRRQPSELLAEAVRGCQAQKPDFHPTYEWRHWLLGVVLVAKGDRDAALIEMERVTVVDGRQLELAPI